MKKEARHILEQLSPAIETGVDRLISYLKGKGQVDLQKAAEALGVMPEIVQIWVDFLVEEKIIGIDYKFTKPLIYLIDLSVDNKPKVTRKQFEAYKKDFTDKAKDSNIPLEKTKFLWQARILQELEKKKEFFFAEAKKRGFTEPTILFQEYKKKVMDL